MNSSWVWLVTFNLLLNSLYTAKDCQIMKDEILFLNCITHDFLRENEKDFSNQNFNQCKTRVPTVLSTFVKSLVN